MSLKKLLTAIVTVSMVFSLVVPAVSADAASDLLAAAIGRMKGFGIVQGDQNGDLKLGDTITRAEIMKVLVTAAGKGDDAQLLRGAPAFSDTQAHWASGYVALAKAMGYTIGYPDGTFRPDNKITYGEIITLVVRAVGLDVSAQAYTWPNNYIHAAMDAGIIPPGIDATKVAGDFAIRSYVFLLADQAFLTVKLPSGKTTYQTHFVTVPPTLTVDQGASLSTSKDMVTISGSTNGISVTVGGAAAELTNGTFSTDVSVTLGSSTIAVVASDAVGNTTTANVAVTRAPAAAASISVDLPASVTAGSETAVTATVKDSYGNEIADAVVTGTCDAAVGTYDEATGKLTAAQAVGSGNCSFSSGAATTGDQAVSVVAGDLATLTINGAASMASSAKQAFTISSADQYGNTVTAPSAVTWSASAGVIDQSGNYAPGGASGAVTITATSGDISATKTVTVYGTAAAIQLSVGSNNIVANSVSTSTLTATVVDSNGNLAAGYSGTVTLANSNSAVAALSGSSVTIANGTGSVTLTAGSTVGSTVVAGSASGLTGGNVTLTTVAQTFTSVSLSADPSSLAADNTSKSAIKAQLLDQTGNPMLAVPSTGVTITVTSGTTAVGDFSTATIPLSAGNTTTNGTADLKAGNTIGTTAVSVSSVKTTSGTAISGISTGTVTVTTGLVGPAYQLTIDPISPALTYGTSDETTQKITVRVKDAFGNQVTGLTSSSTIDLTGTKSDGTTFSGISGGTNVAVTGGKATINASSTKAQTITYKAVTNAGFTGTVASATATGVFNAGAAKGVVLEASPDIIGVGATTTLKVTVVDATSLDQNAVTSGSYSVVIKRTTNGGATSWSGDQTVTTSNGVASITVAGTSTQAQDTFSATITLSDGSTPSHTGVTVNTKVIGPTAQLDFTGATFTSTAGGASKITVNLQDGATSPVVNTADNSTVVTLTAIDADEVSATYTATAVNGVATFTPTFNTAGSYTLKATSGTLKGATGSSDNGSAALTVSAGSATALKVTPKLTTFAADNGTSVIPVYVQFVDAYGNVTDAPAGVAGVTLVSNSADVVVQTSPAPTMCDTNVASTSCTTTSAASAHSMVYAIKSSGSPGSGTLTAAAGSSITSGTAAISTYLAGSATKLAISTIADGTAGSTQTVKVSILDAAGNLVTGSTLGIGLTHDSATASGQGTTNATYGSVTFTITNTKAETVTYTAAESTLTSASAAGKFVPGTADHVVVNNASPQYVVGNGSNIASISAKVVDANENTVTSASGTMKFSVVTGSGDWAFFQNGTADNTITATVSSGVATVVLQAKNVTTSKYVYVAADYTASDASVLTTAWNMTALGVAYDSAAAATYTVSSSGVTYTVTFSQPVRVDTSTSNWTYTGTATSFTVSYNSTGTVATVTFNSGAAITGLVPTGVKDIEGNSVT